MRSSRTDAVGYSTPIQQRVVDGGQSLHLRTRKQSESKSTKKHCLIGCSGSVATLKLPELVAKLSRDYKVLIVCTKNALFFLNRAQNYNPKAWGEFLDLGGMELVLEDSDEWDMWNKIGNDVLHIELRRWADVFLIAPGSANLIAKAAVGISDNLLLSVMRAWDFHKPCIICPAMNTVMWDHPATLPALETLQSWGWQTVGPVEKMLACQEVGNGAMASVDDIVHAVTILVEQESIATYMSAPAVHRQETTFPQTSIRNNPKATGKRVSFNNDRRMLEFDKDDQDEEISVILQKEEEIARHERHHQTLQLTFRMIGVPSVLLLFAALVIKSP